MIKAILQAMVARIQDGACEGLAIFGIVLVALAMCFGAIAFEAFIVMLLWNAIAVQVNLPQFGFWFFVLVVLLINMLIPKRGRNEE